MSRKLILTASELLEFVEGILEGYIGVAASIADHRPLVEITLDYYFYGKTLHSVKTVDEMVTAYGVPTDVARLIADRLSEQLLSVVSRGFAFIWPSRFYIYRWINDGDLLIEEFREEPEALKEIQLVVDPDLHDTGYTPERQRR